MAGQISKQVKQERGRALAELEAELRRAYFRRLLGRRLQVLVEEGAAAEGANVGTSCRYAPVVLDGISRQAGELVDAVATRLQDEKIVAQ